MTIDQLIENANGKFYYLASPYSHPDPFIREARARHVNMYAGRLMQAGVYCIPTIYLTHENTKRFELPTNHEWWIGFNKSLIDPSAGMIIAQIEGWDSSKGIVQEINYCRSIGKSITMMHIGHSDGAPMTFNKYPGK